MRHRRSVDFVGPRAPSLHKALPERLKWTRHDDRSFIACPDGPEHAQRYCRLHPHRHGGGSLSGGWECTMAYDGRSSTGYIGGRQAAADWANQRWLRFVAEIEDELACEAEERAQKLAAPPAPPGGASLETRPGDRT